MKIAIAGASGFVGKALVKKLAADHEVIALSRSHNPKTDATSAVQWRLCDLFSLLDAEKGLAGADVAIYLVHSMRPSAHLSQGSFEDFDLIMADNFVRAAEKCQVKQVIFLGGLHPKNPKKGTRHLRSRQEVEDVFCQARVSYTVLRAALIIGGEGSSFHIMTRLVERLPVMLCPSWTSTKSQPIALSDVIASIEYSLGNETVKNKVLDISGDDVLTYRHMMQLVAKARGLHRAMIPLSLMTPRLSSLWISLISGAPWDLVKLLVEGLQIQMIANPEERLKIPGHQFMSLQNALKEAVQSYDGKEEPYAFKHPPISQFEARSVQRLPLPEGWKAQDVAREYMKYLPTMKPAVVNTEVQGRWVYFSIHFPYVRLLVLEYSPERSWNYRQLFYIRGGLLSQKSSRGRLEFREILGGKACIAAIHDFKPRMPWYFYTATQALFHLAVMKKFSRHLAKLSSLKSPQP